MRLIQSTGMVDAHEAEVPGDIVVNRRKIPELPDPGSGHIAHQKGCAGLQQTMSLWDRNRNPVDNLVRILSSSVWAPRHHMTRCRRAMSMSAAVHQLQWRCCTFGGRDC
jgi:hypothetical protein